MKLETLFDNYHYTKNKSILNKTKAKKSVLRYCLLLEIYESKYTHTLKNLYNVKMY